MFWSKCRTRSWKSVNMIPPPVIYPPLHVTKRTSSGCLSLRAIMFPTQCSRFYYLSFSISEQELCQLITLFQLLQIQKISFTSFSHGPISRENQSDNLSVTTSRKPLETDRFWSTSFYNKC